MNKTTSTMSVSAIVTLISISPSFALDISPAKLTGDGVYQPYQYPSDDQEGRFAISINPDQKAGKRLPRAVVYVDGPVLREVWGGPLVIKDDFVGWYHWEPLRPEDLNPAQAFLFMQEHPEWGTVAIWIFGHDNSTPGCVADDPNWSDWFTVWIEPIDNVDGFPFTGDELYVGCGILVSGNIMDHRR
jgi:hypothetical protein